MERLKYLILLVIFGGLFFVYNYHNVLPKHPESTHQWRQCDGAALVMHYYHNGLNPFDPGVYNLHGNGKTVAEFPIIYYVNACIISVIGTKYSDITIRLVNLLILYLGLFYLFKIGQLFFKKWYWALLPMILYSSFPIVAFYGSTSVPNVPAAALSFVGIFYLLKFLKEPSNKYLFWSIAILTLVGMLKATALIPFLAIFGVLIIAYLFKNKSVSVKFSTLILLLIPLVGTIVWVIIAGKYNAANENITFLLSAKPIWKLERAFINDISFRMKYSWLPQYLFIPTLWIGLALGLGFFLWKNKKMILIKLGLALLIVGTAGYLYLFFEQFYHHDYYAIELLPMLVSFFIAGLYVLDQVVHQQRFRQLVFFLFVGLMIANVAYGRKYMLKRYTEDTKYTIENNVYSEIAPLLRENGIEYSDKVIVSSDKTPNVSLYLMDQLGWTRFPYGMDEEKVEGYVNDGAKYLISREEDLEKRQYLKPYLSDTLIRYKNLLVFKL